MKDKNNISDLNAILDSAQATKEELRGASKDQKDESLKKAAESIDSSRETLKAANEKDMEAASTLNLQDSFIDRLKLDDKRIDSMISGLKKVIDLNDPVGEMTDKSTSPSGFLVSKMRVPLLSLIHISEPTRLITISYAVFCL